MSVEQNHNPAGRRKYRQRGVILCALLLLTNVLALAMPIGARVSLVEPLESWPGRLGEWKEVPLGSFEEHSPAGCSDSVLRRYRGPGGLHLYVYVGFWGEFEAGSQPLSGKHLLPRQTWGSGGTRTENLDLASSEIPVKVMTASKDGYHSPTVYLHQVSGEIGNNGYSSRLAHALRALLGRDSSILLVKVFSEPVEKDQVVDVTDKLLGFTSHLLQALHRVRPLVSEEK